MLPSLVKLSILWVTAVVSISGAEKFDIQDDIYETPRSVKTDFARHAMEISDLLHMFISLIKKADEDDGRELGLPEITTTVPLNLESASLEELFDRFETAARSFRTRFLKYLKTTEAPESSTAQTISTVNEKKYETKNVFEQENISDSEYATEYSSSTIDPDVSDDDLSTTPASIQRNAKFSDSEMEIELSSTEVPEMENSDSSDEKNTLAFLVSNEESPESEMEIDYSVSTETPLASDSDSSSEKTTLAFILSNEGELRPKTESSPAVDISQDFTLTFIPITEENSETLNKKLIYNPKSDQFFNEAATLIFESTSENGDSDTETQTLLSTRNSAEEVIVSQLPNENGLAEEYTLKPLSSTEDKDFDEETTEVYVTADEYSDEKIAEIHLTGDGSDEDTAESHSTTDDSDEDTAESHSTTDDSDEDTAESHSTTEDDSDEDTAESHSTTEDNSDANTSDSHLITEYDSDEDSADSHSTMEDDSDADSANSLSTTDDSDEEITQSNSTTKEDQELDEEETSVFIKNKSSTEEMANLLEILRRAAEKYKTEETDRKRGEMRAGKELSILESLRKLKKLDSERVSDNIKEIPQVLKPSIEYAKVSILSANEKKDVDENASSKASSVKLKSENVDRKISSDRTVVMLKRSVHSHLDDVIGEPGEDYPNLTNIPTTSFTCKGKKSPGLYADLETRCQVFHACWPHRKESYLCPVGSTFNQLILSCDNWFNSTCSLSPDYYDVNLSLQDYPSQADEGLYEYFDERDVYPYNFRSDHSHPIFNEMKYLPFLYKIITYSSTGRGIESGKEIDYNESVEIEFDKNSTLPPLEVLQQETATDLVDSVKDRFRELLRSLVASQLSKNTESSDEDPSVTKTKLQERKYIYERMLKSKLDRSGNLPHTEGKDSLDTETTSQNASETAEVLYKSTLSKNEKKQISSEIVFKALETAENIVNNGIMPLTKDMLAVSYIKLYKRKKL